MYIMNQFDPYFLKPPVTGYEPDTMIFPSLIFLLSYFTACQLIWIIHFYYLCVKPKLRWDIKDNDSEQILFHGFKFPQWSDRIKPASCLWSLSPVLYGFFFAWYKSARVSLFFFTSLSDQSWRLYLFHSVLVFKTPHPPHHPRPHPPAASSCRYMEITSRWELHTKPQRALEFKAFRLMLNYEGMHMKNRHRQNEHTR